MRFFYDAKRLMHNTSGLGVYSRTLINNLAQVYPEHNYVLCSADEGNPRLRAQVATTSAVEYWISQPIKKGLKRTFWRSKGILKSLIKEEVDLFHGLSGEIPFGIHKVGIKTVVTIHDLIFLRHPEYYSWWDVQIYTFKFKYACQHADKIIAISECTKRDIMHYFKIPEEKIEIVYQGCNVIFQQQTSIDEQNRIREKYQLPSKILLSVGTIEQRKNLGLLVKALRYLDESFTIVAIGRSTAYAKKVKAYAEKHQLSHRIKLLTGIPTEELPLFYQLADQFVYPSFYEGFGIPIIEALHSKTPVIAATGSCLEEAGGACSLYVDPNDAKALATAIRKVDEDENLRNRMICEGKKYVARFDKKVISADMMKIYKEVVK